MRTNMNKKNRNFWEELFFDCVLQALKMFLLKVIGEALYTLFFGGHARVEFYHRYPTRVDYPRYPNFGYRNYYKGSSKWEDEEWEDEECEQTTDE